MTSATTPVCKQSRPARSLRAIEPFVGLKNFAHCLDQLPADQQVHVSCRPHRKGLVEQLPVCNIFKIAIDSSVLTISRACLVSE